MTTMWCEPRIGASRAGFPLNCRFPPSHRRLRYWLLLPARWRAPQGSLWLAPPYASARQSSRLSWAYVAYRVPDLNDPYWLHADLNPAGTCVCQAKYTPAFDGKSRGCLREAPTSCAGRRSCCTQAALSQATARLDEMRSELSLWLGPLGSRD
jgi:hypothetical protein